MGNLDFSANADQLKELAAYMASQINVPTIGIGGGYAPIGAIIPLMGTTAPQDYLACDGTVYDIADYPQLANYFESQFGESNHFGGNGTTTFAVPNLQGEFLRGTGTNSHANQGNGAAVGVHQDGTEHRAGGYYKNSIRVLNYPDNLPWMNINSDSDIPRSAGEYKASASSEGTYSEATPSFTSRPTNTSVLYCIKAVVAGEVYSTEERVVGTWIDGKPLYRRCYEFTSTFIQNALNGSAMELTGIPKSTCNIKRYEYNIYRTDNKAVYQGDMNNWEGNPVDCWSCYGVPSKNNSYTNWQFYMKVGSEYNNQCKGGIVIVDYTKTTD